MTSGVNTLSIEQFKRLFSELTSDWSWEIQGFVDPQSVVYPIDSDTKVLSTVFERFSSPVIRSIVKIFEYKVEVANQTTYPDFTLTIYGPNNEVIHRIALDVKTTYAELSEKTGKYSKMKFTLGSYNSFIRNNTKNILYPYSTYDEHWVLGFIYSRTDSFQEYDLETLPKVGQIKCPYKVLNVFIADKVNLIGLRAGSGNTANIGSVQLDDPHHFSEVSGPFTKFTKSKLAADYYWCNYDRLKGVIFDENSLLGHSEFDQFR